METWRTIPGHPNYQVSSKGRVRNARYARLLATCPDRYGYLKADLWANNRRKSIAVHVLVLLAFHGPAPSRCLARHLDGNKLHNTSTNLCWGTSADNAEDRIQHALERRGLKGKVLAGRARNRLAKELLDNGASVGDVWKDLGYSNLQHMADCLATLKSSST